uniref:Uncharacterized protein n=2 Tax=Rhinopithecus TaxID=542827 RepID=A0A2K6MJZ5_RHIBE
MKRVIVLLAVTEIGIVTKQIQTGGLVLPQTALVTTHLEEVMTALETSIETVMIQTGIVISIRKAHPGIWIDMVAGIAMMTKAAEIMIEVMIPR